MTKIVSRSSESGFTLIETAIAILVLGLLAGAFMSYYTVQRQQQETQETKRKLDVIARALSSYAQMNYRLPCPADPAATNTNIGIERTTCTATGTAAALKTRIGIVPWRTLGLDETDAYDGFGNLITYVVAQMAVAPDTTKVHRNCRTGNWWNSGAVNAAKATFCCQQESSSGGQYGQKRLFVSTTIGATGSEQCRFGYNMYDCIPVTATQTRTTTAPTSNKFQAASDGTNNITAEASAVTLDYIAYILISAGENRTGQYVPGTTTRAAQGGPQTLYASGEAEADNVDDEDVEYGIMPYNQQRNNDWHFDDIILWRTQTRVMSELGNNSCATP